MLDLPGDLWEDHPRLRGEHTWAFDTECDSKGSSPPARGAQLNADNPMLWLRIIPACAGSTSPPRPVSRQWSDHPRLRGEHPSSSHTNTLSAGSSPPARGALGVGGDTERL